MDNENVKNATPPTKEKLADVLITVSVVAKKLAKDIKSEVEKEKRKESANMGKMKDLLLSIEEIEVNAKKTLDSISKFKASFATSEEDWNNYRDEELAHDAAKEAKTVEPIKVITLNDVRTVLAELSRDGYAPDVKGLLKAHGAEKLSAVDPKEYATIFAKLLE